MIFFLTEKIKPQFGQDTAFVDNSCPHSGHNTNDILITHPCINKFWFALKSDSFPILIKPPLVYGKFYAMRRMVKLFN